MQVLRRNTNINLTMSVCEAYWECAHNIGCVVLEFLFPTPPHYALFIHWDCFSVISREIGYR